ncbi:MAG TPA: hypothetical protein VKJ07_18035 [Mycobacteriales bacterium]|nr:hypothetical protein [Mycobacteriales bacterium]
MRFEASPRYATVAFSTPGPGVAASPGGSVGTTVGGGAMVGGGTSVGTDVGDATLIVAGAETLSTPSGEAVAVRRAPEDEHARATSAANTTTPEHQPRHDTADLTATSTPASPADHTPAPVRKLDALRGSRQNHQNVSKEEQNITRSPAPCERILILL